MSDIDEAFTQALATAPRLEGTPREKSFLLECYKSAACNAAELYWTTVWAATEKLSPHDLMLNACDSINTVIELALDTNIALNLTDEDFEMEIKGWIVAAFAERLSEIDRAAGGSA